MMFGLIVHCLLSTSAKPPPLSLPHHKWAVWRMLQSNDLNLEFGEGYRISPWEWPWWNTHNTSLRGIGKISNPVTTLRSAQVKPARQLERKIEKRDNKRKTRHKGFLAFLVSENFHGAQAAHSDRTISLTFGCSLWVRDLHRKDSESLRVVDQKTKFSLHPLSLAFSVYILPVKSLFSKRTE